MKLTAVHRTRIVGGVVLAVVTAASWGLLLSPRMTKASQLTEQRAQALTANTAAHTEIVRLKGLQTNLPAQMEIAQRLDRKFPTTADLPTLFAQIIGAATAAGIPEDHVTSITPTPPEVGGNSTGSSAAPTTPAPGAAGSAATNSSLATMHLTIAVKASYSQAVDFLKNLENMDRAFLSTGLALANGDGGDNQLTVTINGDMFVYKPMPVPAVAVDTQGQAQPGAQPVPSAPAGQPGPSAPALPVQPTAQPVPPTPGQQPGQPPVTTAPPTQ